MSESLPLPAAVVVASNRAAAGVYADETGPLIVDALRGWGFEVDAPAVVPDGDPVRDAIAAAVAAIIAGQTGVRDAVAALLARPIRAEI